MSIPSVVGVEKSDRTSHPQVDITIDGSRNQKAATFINRVEGLAWLRKQVEAAASGPLPEIVKVVVKAPMGAAKDSNCGVPFGMNNLERVNRRNGYHHI